jgi:signal transduction histidine kinase
MSKEFLRHLQLFANLSETDLDWLSDQAKPVSIAGGEILIEEGQPADAAYIVMDGEFEVVKKSDVQNIVIAVREPGEVIGEMALLDQAPRMATVRAVRDSTVLKISDATFQELLLHSTSATLSILHTVSQRLRQNEGLLRQNEKMAALGTLAAGLAHELNNPSAAVRRSAVQLRSAVTEWGRLTAGFENVHFGELQTRSINKLQSEIETRHGSISMLDPMAQSDLEMELQTWLEEHGVEQAWEIAPALVSSSWDIRALNEQADIFDPQSLVLVIKWLAAACTVYSLLDEVNIGSERISEIVKSVKAYSYLDQGPIQEVDVHESLENTLVILRHKMKDGIRVTRDYAADLPRIETHGSELNQVWTNIIDNAIDTMQGKGELLLRTYKMSENIVVEIQDNGPGIPPEIQKRIYEPFFTTKPPGMGTGLGLHIAYTSVNNHYGHIHVESEPGKTCFQVTLPIQHPTQAGNHGHK